MEGVHGGGGGGGDDVLGLFVYKVKELYGHVTGKFGLANLSQHQ